MKITFIGLSCFLIENKSGDRLLLDPFFDDPPHSFGLNIPKDLKSDLFLVSHTDRDHSHLDPVWLRRARKENEKDESIGIGLFPDLNLHGLLVKEYSGDLNIAFCFTIDGIRCVHLADNSHILTADQIKEIGPVDIVFLPPAKTKIANIEQTCLLQNIDALHPSIVIPSHLIPPASSNGHPSLTALEKDIGSIVLRPGITNPHANPHTVQIFVSMFMQAYNLYQRFPGSKLIDTDTIEVSTNDIDKKPKIYLFRSCRGLQ